jgi:very-short-patch-repair endonuclease
VDRDGAFSSRRRTGEGFLPFATHLVQLKLRISYSLPLLVRPAPCGATKPKLKKAAWYLLRGRRVDAKFRRQCRIENWVVDFYRFEHRLAIELDGGVHSQPSLMPKDAAKEDYLRTLGISLLRIPNGLVVEDPEEFVRKVREAIEVRMGQMTAR